MKSTKESCRIPCRICHNLIKTLDEIYRHPSFSVTICKTCLNYHNEVDWDKCIDEYGKSDYCNFCTEGGELLPCDMKKCGNSFCWNCLKNIYDPVTYREIKNKCDEDHPKYDEEFVFQCPSCTRPIAKKLNMWQIDYDRCRELKEDAEQASQEGDDERSTSSDSDLSNESETEIQSTDSELNNNKNSFKKIQQRKKILLQKRKDGIKSKRSRDANNTIDIDSTSSTSSSVQFVSASQRTKPSLPKKRKTDPNDMMIKPSPKKMMSLDSETMELPASMANSITSSPKKPTNPVKSSSPEDNDPVSELSENLQVNLTLPDENPEENDEIEDDHDLTKITQATEKTIVPEENSQNNNNNIDDQILPKTQNSQNSSCSSDEIQIMSPPSPGFANSLNNIPESYRKYILTLHKQNTKLKSKQKSSTSKIKIEKNSQEQPINASSQNSVLEKRVEDLKKELSQAEDSLKRSRIISTPSTKTKTETAMEDSSEKKLKSPRVLLNSQKVRDKENKNRKKSGRDKQENLDFGNSSDGESSDQTCKFSRTKMINTVYCHLPFNNIYILYLVLKEQIFLVSSEQISIFLIIHYITDTFSRKSVDKSRT